MLELCYNCEQTQWHFLYQITFLFLLIFNILLWIYKIIMNIYKIIMYNYYNNSIKYFGDLYKCKKLF